MKSILLILFMLTTTNIVGCAHHPCYDSDGNSRGDDTNENKRDHDNGDHWDDRRDDGHMLDHRCDAR